MTSYYPLDTQNMAEAAAPEQTMNLKAVVIGGTGAVGKCLVGELVNSKVR